MIVAKTWNVAFSEAQTVFDATNSAAEAKRRFLALVDQGTAGALAALAGTTYVCPHHGRPAPTTLVGRQSRIALPWI